MTQESFIEVVKVLLRVCCDEIDHARRCNESMRNMQRLLDNAEADLSSYRKELSEIKVQRRRVGKR
jgi:hypothetical protein